MTSIPIEGGKLREKPKSSETDQPFHPDPRVQEAILNIPSLEYRSVYVYDGIGAAFLERKDRRKLTVTVRLSKEQYGYLEPWETHSFSLVSPLYRRIETLCIWIKTKTDSCLTHVEKPAT
jgi:hypothetical protein